MRKPLSIATTLALTFFGANVLASEPLEEPAAPDADVKAEVPKLHDDILLTAGAGFFADDRKGGGAVSLTALRQKGWLGYGATFEYGGALFDYTSLTAAPMIGIFSPGPRGLRIGIAAAGGIHTYDGVGRGFISSSDPGAKGTVAFVGTRLMMGTELGGQARFHIGLQLSADDDLARTRKAYAFTETAFRAAPQDATATNTVGTFRVGAMLTLGTAFDL